MYSMDVFSLDELSIQYKNILLLFGIGYLSFEFLISLTLSNWPLPKDSFINWVFVTTFGLQFLRNFYKEHIRNNRSIETKCPVHHPDERKKIISLLHYYLILRNLAASLAPLVPFTHEYLKLACAGGSPHIIVSYCHDCYNYLTLDIKYKVKFSTIYIWENHTLIGRTCSEISAQKYTNCIKTVVLSSITLTKTSFITFSLISYSGNLCPS